MTIVLTQQEVSLFAFLEQVANNNNVIIRVAGGWVRDKLLGKPSHDIDIAVEGCSGFQFATVVQDALKSIDGNYEHSIGVIQANPEKSKNLETATTKVFDYHIDFVGLRAETYSQNSRVPEIVVGTPQQDAARRDFTINALFYNINTKQVEDFVNGLYDLQN